MTQNNLLELTKAHTNDVPPSQLKVVLGAPMGSEMEDVLRRLRQAIPRVESWMRELHASHAGRAQAVASLGFDRLAKVWPAAILEETRAVSVDKTPFPPASEYGLPEFEAMAQGAWAGITFGHMYFVDRAQSREGVHFHELCHVVQWKTLGASDFLLTYAVGILLHGYRASALEAIAYDLQDEFESGSIRTGLTEDVAVHAREANAQATAMVRSYDRGSART